MGRMDIRGDDQLIERIKQAAQIKRRSLNSFVLLVMEQAANNVLGEEQPPEVHASAPVKEVVKKVLPEPSSKPLLSELMQPGQEHWDEYCSLIRGKPNADDFVDFLKGLVEFIDDRPKQVLG